MAIACRDPNANVVVEIEPAAVWALLDESYRTIKVWGQWELPHQARVPLRLIVQGPPATAGVWLGRGTAAVYGVIERFLIEPTTDIARRFGDWVPVGDSAVGRLTGLSGQLALAAARAPALPLVIVLAVVLALVFALVAPGVAR